MYKYAVIFLICVNISVGDPSCCEDEVKTKSFLEAATNMISKAIRTVPNCSKIKERDGDISADCADEVRTKSFSEAAMTMISKAIRSVPKCSKIKERDGNISVDCADLYRRGYNKSGVYTIQPVSKFNGNKTLDVYCDMDTDGGGWTVIQRRGNFGNTNHYFYRDWQSYKTGFGSVEKDFWLGNDNIFALSNQKDYSIRFDLQDKDGKTGYANYESFRIDDEYNNYTLRISGYSGDVGDGMDYHNSKQFSTKDKQNDKSGGKPCAIEREGAWWYHDCYSAHLNGVYGSETDEGIYWLPWKSAKRLTSTEMKIRPKNFAVKYATNNVKRESVGKSYLKNIMLWHRM